MGIMPAAILYVRKLLQIIVLPCLLTNSGFTSNIATGADVMRDLFTIISEIHKFDKSPVIVAVDGRSAAGKTTLSWELKKELGCNVIHMDDFFLRPEQRTGERLDEPGGNVDRERFIEEVMKPLKAGKAFSYRVFDCKSMTLTDSVHVEPRPVTVVEGAYSCHPDMWDDYNLRIFLNIEPGEQLRRIMLRNGEETAKMFCDRWIPLEERYFAAYHIMERCDLRFDSDKGFWE